MSLRRVFDVTRVSSKEECLNQDKRQKTKDKRQKTKDKRQKEKQVRETINTLIKFFYKCKCQRDQYDQLTLAL